MGLGGMSAWLFRVLMRDMTLSIAYWGGWRGGANASIGSWAPETHGM